MKKLLQSTWTASTLGGVLFLLTMLLAWKPPERSVEVHEPKEPARVPNWALNLENPEVFVLVEELKREKDLVKKRQTDLDALAERLRVERLEIENLTKAVARMREQFDAAQSLFESNVVRLTEAEHPKLRKLAKTYVEMTPEGAAAVFRQMDDRSIVKILALLKEPEAAAILEAMAQGSDTAAKRVADISELLRTSLDLPNLQKKTP